MFSFRRAVAILAFIWLVSSGVAAFGQNFSSNQPTQEQTPAPAPTAQAPAATQNQGQVSVRSRIRARREARRVQAIHDTYSHPYEIFVGAGYQRFIPGPDRQHATMYAWNLAATRYWSEKLGLTFDGRGNYGTAFVGLNPSSITRPAISYYTVMVGPTYRFKTRPKYSIAGRVEGGAAFGNFSGDTNGFGSFCGQPGGCLLYQDGTTYAFNASVIGEWNLTPSFSLRLAPEYMANGFGTGLQNDFGATFGFVYRFGKH
jgi:hypothetical protein